MTKYYIEMKETRRNMMSDALLSLYRKKGPESEEARQMGLKLWDFDLKRGWKSLLMNRGFFAMP